jgi:hypothetical protein
MRRWTSTRAYAAAAESVRAAIEPFDVINLNDEARRNWYPVVPRDLFDNAHKLGSTREQIEEMLERTGALVRP